MESYSLNTTIRNCGASRLSLKRLIVSHRVKKARKDMGFIPLRSASANDEDAVLASLVFGDGEASYVIGYGDTGNIIEPGGTRVVDIPTMGRDGEAEFELQINETRFGPFRLKSESLLH